ncbi:neuropeptides capa receptor-like [Diaphorina citri]|uniref:Neuropeptide receptor n=1 Tax=Diaphorina citri TaxID=121845 RepID=A0A1S4EN32_DIACI|nr:neuropeptides capa receptor-like [Diaphorina citri]AWT50648.1 neuropeptide receptor [Diaphorina citri]KAI5703564.1 hypothetical protein M8J75_013349 [Diaphorina citri]KAI5732890.1 hypothetical protein M8J76_005357 [Diaphorina citri]
MEELESFLADDMIVYNCSMNDSMITSYNWTVEHYLYCMRGPKRLHMSVLLPITIVYFGIFVTGVIGNIAVCVVIINNTSLHTATNYYLFSLAVSDLTLLLLGLPNDLGVFWQQYPWVLGEELCKFRALVSEMTNYTSVLTIVAFSMERYLAICHPLLSYAMSGLRRAIRIIAVLWLFGFLCATPFAVYTTINYVDFPPGSGEILYESGFCGMLEVPRGVPMYELSFLFFFFIPMLVIMLMYTRIGLRIRSRSRHSLGKRVEGTVHGETKRSQSRKSIIRMLTAVVTTFFLCWAPFHAQRLIYLYARDSQYFASLNEWLFMIAGGFYYVSSTVNPILYNVMSVKYRQAFKQTLCCRGGSHGSFARDQSSFRETMVDVASPQWSRAMTWKRQPSRRPNNVSASAGGADIVVQLIPDGEKEKFHWSKTLLRVTMGRSNSSLSLVKSKQTSDVNNKVCIGLEMETCI